MQKAYATWWPGKIPGEIEILETIEEETKASCRNLNETEKDPDFFVQK